MTGSEILEFGDEAKAMQGLAGTCTTPRSGAQCAVVLGKLSTGTSIDPRRCVGFNLTLYVQDAVYVLRGFNFSGLSRLAARLTQVIQRFGGTRCLQQRVSLNFQQLFEALLADNSDRPKAMKNGASVSGFVDLCEPLGRVCEPARPA